MKPLEHIRTNIRALAAYIPGEQPSDGTYVRLNTNENPYPPSPRVLEAMRAALAGDRLRRYPDPTGRAFRATAAKLHGVDPDSILIGNGSDDVLTVITRTFVPEGGLMAWPTPSYVLYRTMAGIQGARFQEVSFTEDWKLPNPWPVRGAHLTLIANPSSPSGTCLDAAELPKVDGTLVIDEAYVDFAEQNCMHLVSKPNIIVTRTLSKSYALAGVRFGYAVADPAVVRELMKVKDTYNCDVLSLEAARAALEDQEYMRQTRAKIVATRGRLVAALKQTGFEVAPSAANFVWVRSSTQKLKPVQEELKKRKILVRYFTYEGHGEGLRISVGTDEEIDRLIGELRKID